MTDGIAFPNGMAVTPDNSTLIVAESYGNRLTAFDIEADGKTLFIVATEWKGAEQMADGSRTGQVLTVQAPAPHAGWP